MSPGLRSALKNAQTMTEVEDLVGAFLLVWNGLLDGVGGRLCLQQKLKIVNRKPEFKFVKIIFVPTKIFFKITLYRSTFYKKKTCFINIF